MRSGLRACDLWTRLDRPLQTQGTRRIVFLMFSVLNRKLLLALKRQDLTCVQTSRRDCTQAHQRVWRNTYILHNSRPLLVASLPLPRPRRHHRPQPPPRRPGVTHARCGPGPRYQEGHPRRSHWHLASKCERKVRFPGPREPGAQQPEGQVHNKREGRILLLLLQAYSVLAAYGWWV